MLYLIFFIIAVALLFDVMNGFHDSANSVATIVSTRVLSPFAAVFWAAFFNFIAAFLFGTGVASTISSKLIDPKAVDVFVVFGGLIGAIAWDIITWIMALPTSSSHAIISGFAGAAIAKAGFKVLLLKGWIPVFAFLVISPLIGLVLGYLVMTAASWITYHAKRKPAEKVFRRLQFFSAGAYSLGHGGNDAQKTMGVIVALLVAGGKKPWTENHSHFMSFGHKHEIAWWIILSCHAAMAVGTAAGGWRIIKTMGQRITPHLRPIGGFSAEVGAATAIAVATFLKIPISTTHSIGGGIAGVGATRGWHAVRWVWAQRIVWAWVLTFPGAALIGAAAFCAIRFTIEPMFRH